MRCHTSALSPGSARIGPRRTEAFTSTSLVPMPVRRVCKSRRRWWDRADVSVRGRAYSSSYRTTSGSEQWWVPDKRFWCARVPQRNQFCKQWPRNFDASHAIDVSSARRERYAARLHLVLLLLQENRTVCNICSNCTQLQNQLQATGKPTAKQLQQEQDEP